MPESSSSMNSQLRESRVSLTSSPAPCFLPFRKKPVQERPSLIKVWTPLPLAELATPSPWNQTSLPSSPTLDILNLSSCLLRKLETNSNVRISCLFFSSSSTDFRLLPSTFFFPVSLRISSKSNGVSSSMSPKSWQPRSSLPSFSRMSMQVRLLKGRMASDWQCRGAVTLYLLRLRDFSPIWLSLTRMSLKSELRRMTFCSLARLEMQKRLASSSMKKYLISQDFLCWFSRNKTPIRQFRQCIKQIYNPQQQVKAVD